MVQNMWQICDGVNHMQPLEETAWRIVETQEIIATRKLVDSYEEQMLLEEMLSTIKPPIIKEYLNYHPLLYTPFRYPPLKYGSRFGKKSESSLWYGSLILQTAFAEKAFYQLNFLRASSAEYHLVECSLTAFSATIKTEYGVCLHTKPFAQYISAISSPISYEASQALGTAMREANIHAFTYQSARAQHDKLNIALFTPNAFSQKKPSPKSFQSWQCFANKHIVEFVRSGTLNIERQNFTVDEFLIDGILPFPAN